MKQFRKDIDDVRGRRLENVKSKIYESDHLYGSKSY